MDFWYSHNTISQLLRPLSGLYKGIAATRKFLYQKNILSSQAFPVPIIVVGNISVGGTGKTPLTIYLAELLRQQGFVPGIVSRGYKANIKTFPHFVDTLASATDVGDEAVLMARRSGCPVVIAPKRNVAIKALLGATNCNVILADDGLQHYAMQRDIEIAVLDGQRRCGNELCLPAGPLREPVQRLQDVDFVVVKGEAAVGEYAMQLLPGELCCVQRAAERMDNKSFIDKPVHAVAGIGNPESFFQTLKSLGYAVIPHYFPDHYTYQVQDLNFQDDLPIIMTEKDAVKCESFSLPNLWYLNVNAMLPEDFNQNFLNKVPLVSSAQSFVTL